MNCVSNCQELYFPNEGESKMADNIMSKDRISDKQIKRTTNWLLATYFHCRPKYNAVTQFVLYRCI
jgi:hypothetical protein